MNLTPIEVTTWEGDTSKPSTTIYVSYAEGIRMREELLNEVYNEDYFNPEESVESLDKIIRWTIKKIKQDHCS